MLLLYVSCMKFPTNRFILNLCPVFDPCLQCKAQRVTLLFLFIDEFTIQKDLHIKK
jgi:hypothetical protein